MELAFIDNYARLKKGYLQSMEPVCRKWGLTQNELAVLLFLHANPGTDRLSDLVNCCGMAKSHASMSANHLEEIGYLTKQPDETDRRSVHLHLSQAARAPVLEAEAVHREFLERILSGISSEELAVYQTISSKISQNLSNNIEK